MSDMARARAYKERMNRAGFVQCVLWVPPAAMPELRRAAEIIRNDPKLTVARLVDTTTGKLRGLKRNDGPLAPDDGVRTGPVAAGSKERESAR